MIHCAFVFSFCNVLAKSSTTGSMLSIIINGTFRLYKFVRNSRFSFSMNVNLNVSVIGDQLDDKWKLVFTATWLREIFLVIKRLSRFDVFLGSVNW